MGRILLHLVFLFLYIVPIPGLTIFHHTILAIDKSFLIKGKVVDAETKVAVQFADIALICEKDSVPLRLTATNARGEFAFNHLDPAVYTLTVHFMGFRKYFSGPISLSGNETEIKLEAIALEIETVALNEVTVKSGKKAPFYQLDKKTIYVENQLSGAGGTALDLLHKLPSVTQKPDGQIAIHGNSNLLVFINNKPSSMKGTELLEYTVAADVKKIELITSPSAKYDASGSGGIINLITKKSSLDGVNGNVMVAADQLGGYSSDLLLNYKKDKLNFFTGIDHNRRRNEGDVDYETNYLSDQTHFTQTGEQKSQRLNTAFRTGVDYQPSLTDKISLSGHLGTFETTNNADWQTVQSSLVFNTSVQNSATDSNDRQGTYSGADITYEHNFKKQGKSVSVSALWNAMDYDDHYLNLVSDLDGHELMKQSTFLDKRYNNYQINTDYLTPTGKRGILELGYQLVFNNEKEHYQSEMTQQPPPVVSSQETEFKGVIGAGYGTWQLKINKLDIKTGLRAEYLNREMKTSDKSYPVHQFDLYPSLNSSYKIDTTQEIILNYSRRTDQLKTIQLDPLPRWYNFYNVMIGNPNLINEITDKIAIDYLVNFSKLTLVNEIYLYHTADKIEVIQSIYQDKTIQNRYENTGTEKTWGFEINANWSACNWLRLSEKLDFIDSQLEVKLEPIAVLKRYQQWYSVTTAEFTISPSMMLELDFSYYGPAMTAQSSVDECYLAGLSFRKTFLDRKLTFTLSGRDVLGVYKKVEHIQGTDFNQVMTMDNRLPVRFSLSYKFNNYKRNERRVAKSPLTE